ncbi:MAG: hypothetical protein AB7Q42_12435 [Acidimicrobiia bacterium]
MNVKSIDLSIDVTDATGYGQPASIAATVHLPDPTRLAQRPVVCVAFPGGGYSRRYYSMDLPDAPGGQAAWHTDRGWIVVAIDHLQVGDSSVYEPDLLTFEHITAANSAAVQAVLARLAAGTITDGFPAIADPFVAGIGQSMGGCVTVVLQGQRQPFDCIGVLGYSAIHTVVPSAPGVANVAMPWLSRVGYPSSATIRGRGDHHLGLHRRRRERRRARPVDRTEGVPIVQRHHRRRVPPDGPHAQLRADPGASLVPPPRLGRDAGERPYLTALSGRRGRAIAV